MLKVATVLSEDGTAAVPNSLDIQGEAQHSGPAGLAMQTY
jgi:hypothetical protein